MLDANLIKMYEQSFRDNREMSAVTDYFSGETYSYYGFAKEIAKLHILFDEAGIKPGDKIALVGRNTPRWCAVYIATITYGAVIVPIMQTFTSNDIAHIVNHSESRLLFLTDSYWEGLDEDSLPEVEAVFSITDYHALYEREGNKLTKFVNAMTENYRKRFPNGFTVNDIKYADVPNDALMVLSYTSGTTGYSKGVMLTVNNLTANVYYAVNKINKTTGAHWFQKGRRTLAFLPLAHAFGCAFDFLAPLAAGGHINLLGKMPTPKVLVEAMAKVQPSIICSVPLVLEKVYRKQIAPMLEKGPLSIAMKVPLVNEVVRMKIKEKLMASFGGNLEMFIVGGAPMNKETEAFLKSIRFPIIVGYGMTECAPLICVTPQPEEYKLGSCGKYLSDYLDVKIESNDPQHIPGEIMVKGEMVMQGYYKNAKDTEAVLEPDGWMHTGDMGIMDTDGTVYIKGRCKTMILTDTGQNIYPEQIEDKLNNMPLVLESLVLENEGKLYGLVVPDFDQCEKEGIDRTQLEEIMKENLKNLNEQVAAYERLVSIAIHQSEFEKTPKRSIKRYLYDVKRLGIK
ncbi:MAG: AMP-binding protein [Alistipes sp.]|nr:AMP-binding protein [Alistipes sp.]